MNDKTLGAETKQEIEKEASRLIISPLLNNTYEVMEDFNINDVSVPKGYCSNGADVPRLFWSIIPPFKPKYMPAVIVHDFLCDLEQYVLADTKFKEILLSIEDSFITRTMVYAVKLYHKFKYKVKE